MSNKLQLMLETKNRVLADGALGINLFGLGLKQGDPTETWNKPRPEKIMSPHKAMVDARVDIILTNELVQGLVAHG